VNLNHILFFLALVSPLLVLARAWRPGAPYSRWRLAALVVLAVTAGTWLFWADAAGYIGGLAWLLLLFLPAIGLRKMMQLAEQGDYRSAGNVGAAVQIFHPSGELRKQVRWLRHTASDPALRRAFISLPKDQEITVSSRGSQLRNAPAVVALILVNILMFLFEVSVGDYDDPHVLHRIGALEPYAVVLQHEYSRLFTALFLHGGFLHLGFNLFALCVLGPPLESAIGTIRFAACYLISGLASSAGVVALTVSGFIPAAQVIGASGCIMGVVGGWAGFLLRYHNAPLAKQRLANVALIVMIQIAFDLSTPQVSMAAHMCGLVAGFLVGLVLARRPCGGER
jgi:membrane associated rhomboid family serine protease